ncbi:MULTISPECIES: amino acid ABC transporter permease [Brevibacillus]|jgi:putative glutamine transport system permease protein|uniref:Glutamine ABC transporter permease n=1 Tax=Brevibacillus parabrevis TaxID=54914 RepID=A0A4Y3PJ46_BREPA|nr:MULTISPECIES: amino acid ABC transporter permease [Brevibacillus]MBU8712634.1 amino acid ABC transporter permease [Brevibacillus parabrevis]MDH6348133.1 putative glutamine transport system permease protein [Brevibacillus sp. 1238]MDR5000258.1 amino acid ABC transporter permease [Brevibacillus parabrevis]MED2256756.1 amino acid ABC transporter permease [Brevibacillus parabrevis]NRQ52659.1 amino acid ABC transporter permease [Brevibacillus sp. HD1.4A]
MDFIGAYAPSHLTFLLEGFWLTLQVAFLAIVFSFAIAIVVGVLRYANIPGVSQALATVVELIRNLPLLLIIFFTYFALPEVGIKLDKFYAAVLALVIFEAAMLSEIVRSGLKSVEKGQIEAARSSGLTYVQTLWHIILPQALRRMVPPIVSQFISLLKDTSLAVVIALPELMNHAQIINGRNVNYVIPTFLLVAVMYFVVNYALSIVSKRLENKHA